MTQSVDDTAGRRPWFTTARICILIPLFSIGACSTMDSAESGLQTGTFGSEERVETVDQTILDDMTDIVTQLFEPIDTTLQVNYANNDPLLQYFIDQLVNSGYGIQRVSADQGANYVSYRRDLSKADGTSMINYRVFVGAVEIARDYSVPRMNIVAPASVFRLSGTRESVTVNDRPSGRKIVTDPSLSQAQYFASLQLDEQAPVISLITPQLVERVSARSADGPSLQALNSSKIEVNNLFYGGGSTFSSLLDNYQRVHKQVIVFGNDSMVLGDTNKSLIDQLVDSKFRNGDIISLVGCSNGATSLDIGNEGLALGRAKRVTEALLNRGIAREYVLDEGCWAPVSAGDAFPSRGVVLELWRENA